MNEPPVVLKSPVWETKLLLAVTTPKRSAVKRPLEAKIAPLASTVNLPDAKLTVPPRDKLPEASTLPFLSTLNLLLVREPCVNILPDASTMNLPDAKLEVPKTDKLPETSTLPKRSTLKRPLEAITAPLASTLNLLFAKLAVPYAKIEPLISIVPAEKKLPQQSIFKLSEAK